MRLTPALSLLFTVLAVNASAQTDDASQSEITAQPTLLLEVQRAKPIKRVDPRYPRSSAMRMQEGWVEISYVIDKDGNVIDPVVTDSSGEKAFEKSALKAMKKWEFSPAIQNGEAIEQCDSKIRLDFMLGIEEKGVRKKFRQAYLKADTALKEGELDEAQEILAEMRGNKIWNRSENAWFWLLSGRIAEKAGNSEVELASLHRANDQMEVGYLGTEIYHYNLYRIFILELDKRNYKQAYNTFEKLQTLEGADRFVDNLKPYFEQVGDLLSSDKPLIQSITIGERGTKLHELHRNAFTLSVTSGELDMLDIRCLNKRTKYTVEPDAMWKIPEKWGQCNILFEGDEGTTFDIIEVTDNALVGP
jgi:TonB family protein